MDAEVLSKCARTAEGYERHVDGLWEFLRAEEVKLTLTLHRDRLLPVRRQNRDLREFGDTRMTGSTGRCGIPGTVESCRAAETGKYIPLEHSELQ
jgi:hypothetical protein